ncbi:hypothetical protein FLONG3_4188 [Fusarium longipes]|uniref:Uncharacterized protein n=1 Tax=Fusarium longipes TaxID=694270 RepID=A0A395T069_9HYPO|nr:hypothetical protein FLONG3_4188 [Fusarium longipes]
MPSPNFDLYDKRSQLGAANNAREFMEIVRRRNEPRTTRKDSKKKITGNKRSLSPSENPTNKVQSGLEVETTTTTKESPKKRIKFSKGGAKGVASSSVPKTAQQTNDHTVPKTLHNGKPSNEANQEMVSPGVIGPYDGKLTKMNETMTTPQEPNGGGVENNETFPIPQHHDYDTPMEDASTPNPESHMPRFCRTDILDVATAVQDVTANQWDEFKPKLLDMIDKLQADPTPKQSEAAVRRLKMAIANIEQERSLIPIETWEKYEEKLIKKAKDGVFDANWSVRLSKIGKVIWLDEELAAMKSKDWNRLRAAARTWTILADIAGPMMEESDIQRSSEWLLEKLGDINFMERMFASKERLGAIKR